MILFELTDKNHLQWYVGDRLYGERESVYEDFKVSLGKAKLSEICSFKQELYKAVDLLVATHGTKLNVFYSGGSDSEVLLRVLLSLGVQPKVHTIEFDDGSNKHETEHAKVFCEGLGLQRIVHKHQIRRYLDERLYEDMASIVGCSQLAYLTVLEYARLANDAPVLMGGEVYLQKHQIADGAVTSLQEWYYIYREDEDACTYRYTKVFNHPIINEVFTYTPGLLYSYLTHPLVSNVANNKIPGKITLLSIKKHVYEQELGVKLHAQTKFHGYEALTWTNRQVSEHLKGLLKPRTARLEYHQLLKDLVCE